DGSRDHRGYTAGPGRDRGARSRRARGGPVGGGGAGLSSDSPRGRRRAGGAGLLRPARAPPGPSQDHPRSAGARRPAHDAVRRADRGRGGRRVRAPASDPSEAVLMSPYLALRLVTYLLVCDGVAGLLLADLIGVSGAALVVLVMLASWWLEGAREPGVVRPWVAWGLVGASAVAIAMDLLYLASTALHGMVHLLLFLILGRLFLRRSLRDLRSAGFLSFFLLVATSSATFSATFLFVFMAFL